MSKTKYFALQPARFRLDGGAMYGIIPKPLWQKVSPPDELNRIDLSLRCLLIRTESKNIVIDTGIGDYHPEKFNEMFDVRTDKNPLSLCLKELGLTPEDITDLVLSHLHFDHAGGIGAHDAKGEMLPIFKKATLHLHKEHYQYSKSPSLRDKGSFHDQYYGPVLDYYLKADKIHWLEGKSGTILDYKANESLKYMTSNGHTPHLLHPYDEKFIYLADIIPTSNHVHIPWVMGYDIMPGLTTADKNRILEEIEKKNLIVIFEHDVNFWGCSIIKNDRGQFIPGEKFKAIENKTQKILES